MNDYGPKNNRGYRCTLVVIDNSSKFGWTIRLKNKYAQSVTDLFSQIVKRSACRPNLLETDDGRNNLTTIRTNSQTLTSIKDIPLDLGANTAERFNITIGN